MRVLLVNSNRFKHPWPVVPLGISYVASSVEKAGHEVDTLDLCFSKNTVKAIYRKINDFMPDVIGIGIRNIDNSSIHNTIFLLDEVKSEVIDPFKRAFSGPLVLGGAAVGISGAEMLHFFDLDFAIRGDGEAAMVEFLRRLEANIPLEDMPGLILRRDGKIIEDNQPFFIENLDLLPVAGLHKYLDVRRYCQVGSPLVIQTKRGCTLNCTYCTYNVIEGSYYRLRDPKLIANEIESLVKETCINHIEFTDSTFNIPLNHAKAVLRELLSRNLDLRLGAMGLNPGSLDAELAGLMKAAGFQEVELGVESCCDDILESLGKNFRKADILRTANLLHEHGIPISWCLLFGAPGETRETIQETLDTVIRNASKWDLCRYRKWDSRLQRSTHRQRDAKAGTNLHP